MRFLVPFLLVPVLAAAAATAAQPALQESREAPAPPTAAELASRLEAARSGWDLAAAESVLHDARQLRAAAGPGQASELRIRAGALVAELLRLDFELAAEAEAAERRQLGQRIDAIAGEALELLGELPETSERARLEADLVAVMIRSDYRAKRFEARLKAAIARALELDPDNPQALVSAAKPLVFAPPQRGQDLAEALRLLARALELAPGHEAARLLRAEALERSGDLEGARAQWRAALEANPDCRPARVRLGR